MSKIKKLVDTMKKRAGRRTHSQSPEFADGVKYGLEMAIKMAENEFYFELHEGGINEGSLHSSSFANSDRIIGTA